MKTIKLTKEDYSKISGEVLDKVVKEMEEQARKNGVEEPGKHALIMSFEGMLFYSELKKELFGEN